MERGGHLSGPFEQLASAEQKRAILGLLELRDDIGLPDPRVTVPHMVDVAARYPKLNPLNLEAVAFARDASATIWLSAPSAAGILPAVLDGEGIPWETLEVE